jgi:hypothetical protein
MTQITKATAPSIFLPPKFNLWVLRIGNWLLPYWLKYKLQITQIDVVDIDRLVEVYKQSQMGKFRLMLTFRHPSSDDPFCLGYVLTMGLPAAAVKHGILLEPPIFAHFLYNPDRSSWAGKIASWVYCRLGGIPIDSGRADYRAQTPLERLGLDTARNLLVNSHLPILMSPEGSTNGRSEFVNPLESKVAQIGFSAMDDLVNAGKTDDVCIVPIGIQYHYVDEPWVNVENLLHQLEQKCGSIVDRHDSLVSIFQSDRRPMRKLLYDRFYRVCQHILYQIENFYGQFYHYEIPKRPPVDRAISRTEISRRLKSILDSALQVSESYFNLEPIGTKFERCRRIEQAGRDWIYRDELTSAHGVSAISHKLADRIVTEADLRMWHMKIVENLIAITSPYVKEKPTIERFADNTLLLWDLIAQIEGNTTAPRPILGKRRAKVTICNPISIADYWDRYLSNSSEAKQAIVDLTQEIQTSMEEAIDRRKQGKGKKE